MLEKGFLKDDDLEPRIDGLEFYFDAFKELGTCRPMSLGVGLIPFTAVLEYFRLYGDGEFEDFLYVIRCMDYTYVRLQNGKSEKGNKNGSNDGSKTDPNKR